MRYNAMRRNRVGKLTFDSTEKKQRVPSKEEAKKRDLNQKGKISIGDPVFRGKREESVSRNERKGIVHGVIVVYGRVETRGSAS
jgi:hypothetical protein